MQPIPVELLEYVNGSDSSFRWNPDGPCAISMTSQTWRSIPWTHSVTFTEGGGDLAVLMVTGGEPNEFDAAEEKLVAARTGLTTATLYHIPNQPLFELFEDDLIAHTFVEYLETLDPSWPLLFPMVKSVVRAMDALQERTRGRIKRFVVTGLSKRGWTTWLTAAIGDPRVAGIAPMVIDNLNVEAQMTHQLETWGAYSDMIEPYTVRELQAKLQTPHGRHLGELVDPFTYRREITVPTLIVNGGNDPYWQVDATSLYWSQLSQPKWLSIVPNVGHILGDKVQALEALCAFSSAVAGQFAMPTPEWRLERQPGGLMGAYGGEEPTALWVARSETLDFRESEWVAFPTGQTIEFEAANAAAMLASRFPQEGGFTLTSPVQVFRSLR